MYTSEPLVLYKHLRSSHATRMVDSGEVRIALLHSYRSGENLLEGIRDNAEGRFVVSAKIHSFDADNVTRETKFEDPQVDLVVRRLIHLGEHASIGKLTIGSAYAEDYAEVSNYPVYCMTEVSVPGHFGDEYDAVVRINDVSAFVVAVSAQFRQSVAGLRQPLVQPCMYAPLPSVNVYNRSSPDLAFVKRESFAHQREHRIVWPTMMVDESPIILRGMDIAATCERVV
jgi:hypothetical protein